jgi:hypothetical protein
LIINIAKKSLGPFYLHGEGAVSLFLYCGNKNVRQEAPFTGFDHFLNFPLTQYLFVQNCSLKAKEWLNFILQKKCYIPVFNQT